MCPCIRVYVNVFEAGPMVKSLSVIPRAAGVSGRTRRSGERGGVNITPLVISRIKRRGETGQAAIESFQHNFSNACLIFLK